jgi:hypothetical protein
VNATNIFNTCKVFKKKNCTGEYKKITLIFLIYKI